jgi:hypothetical protein
VNDSLDEWNDQGLDQWYALIKTRSEPLKFVFSSGKATCLHGHILFPFRAVHVNIWCSGRLRVPNLAGPEPVRCRRFGPESLAQPIELINRAQTPTAIFFLL